MAGSNAYTDAAVAGVLDWEPELLVHVPSSHAAPLIRAFEQAGTPSVLANREEEAVGIAGGAALAGKRALIVMQDNGFGNALTALTTFAKAYHVGLPILANTRGGLGEYNAMIHEFSAAVPALLTTAGIHHTPLGPHVSPEAWRVTTRDLCRTAVMTRRPMVALLDLLHPAVELRPEEAAR
ncbi:thiamine pyrophosphate-binding protein [Saccharopolyspora elongata]|uniref:Thiamine pyrophosphate-binding protein n=1 Tax=Saccharopolyspora elongata TaxID=2530387 RepID=A0A4R4ZCF5_9PSEU|nr:thiamine pyrophosphate-binding protein [Saccharopolyspora elongata]TDD55965.1 thiamine pyrophosphate-binding protein [Saccharopolyspora elongata]